MEIAKSAQSQVMQQILTDMQITEWSQAGKKVIRYPIDLGILLQSTLMSSYHARCLEFKRIATIGNGYTTENPKDAAKVAEVLSDYDLDAFVHDCDLFANGYLERESTLTGRVTKLHHVRANSLWKWAAKPGGWVQKQRPPETDKDTWREIPAGKIVHLRQYSPLSDHYGVPSWVATLLPVALAWESNDFKRKFYQNGAHAGLLILLTGMTGLTEPQMKELERQIKSTKGPGNFNTLFIALKNAEAKVTVSGVAKEMPARDDYPEIQKSSREQILTAHGLPPRLMAIILDAKGGATGGAELDSELRLFNLSTVEPRQRRLENFLNPLLPVPIKFNSFLPDKYGLAEPDPKKPGAPGEQPQEPEAEEPEEEQTPTEPGDAAVS
jgi:PBSX family phage portal protein